MSRHPRYKISHTNHALASLSSRRIRPLVLAVSIVGALMAATPAAHAGTTRWKTDAGTQNWFNAHNWTGGVPDTTMDVIIDNTDPNGKGVLLSDNNSTVRSVAIGAQNTGLLTVNGGAQLTVRKGFILGNTKDSAGTLNLSGAGTSISIGDVFHIGPTGDGVLNITGGAKVTDESASLADFNGYIFDKTTGTYKRVSNPSTAKVVVSGKNSVWSNNNGLNIGNGGKAIVTLAAGGKISVGDGSGGKGTVKAGWAPVSQALGQINIGAAKGDAAVAPGVLDAATLAFGNYGKDATGAQEGGGELVFNHTSSNYVFAPQVTGHAHINFLSGTTTLTATGSSVVSASIDQGATAILSGGSLDLDVAGEVHGYNATALTVGNTGAGRLTLTNGADLLLGGLHAVQVAQAAGSTGTINIGAPQGSPAAAPGSLAFSSDAAQSWIQFGAGTGTLVFNHTSDAYGFDATLKGDGHLTQQAGTTILTANNSGFIGPVSINGGTLLVNNTAGSGTGSGDVTVNANGSLGGTGEIAGNVKGVGAGSLQGVQGQTLTIDGNLTLNNNSNINVTLNTPDKSVGMFNVKGDLVLDGKVNVTDGGSMGPGVYRVFDYSGTLTDHTLVIGSVPTGVSKTAFKVQMNTAASQVNLVSSAGQQLFYWDGDTADNATNGKVDGGDGNWTAKGSYWTNAGGTTNVVMSKPGFAIFETTGGSVTVDDPNASVTGMQFAADGYTLAGSSIALTTDQDDGNIIRVGDGTAAGAGMTATINSVLTGGTGLHKTDSGTLVLTGANQYSGGTTIEGGVLQVSKNANLGAGTNTNAVTLDGGILRTVDGFKSARPFVFTDAAVNGGIDTNGGNATITGKISGPGSLVKLGTGTLILNAANSSGGTIVKAGLLTGYAGSIGGDVGISSGATVQFNQQKNATFVGNFTGQGDVILSGTKKTLTLTGQSAGTLNWQVKSGNLISSADLFRSNADIGGGSQLVFKQDASSNYGGKLTGSGQFTKQGAGIVQLTGDNSAFAGSTLINDGGITVSDMLGGSVSVSKGASLGGTGEVLGKVGVDNGGILLGDQKAGPLTMHGLVLHNGSQVNVSLSGPGNTAGLFNVQGDLTLDGTLNITSEGDSFGKGVYRLMDYSGTLTDNGMNVGTVPGGFNSKSMAVQTSVANQVNLVTAAGDLQFWDGDAAGNAGNGKIDGGDGTWTAASTNWTDKNGTINDTMNPVPGFAIFEAAPGTVTVDDSKGDVSVSGMQFNADGYQLAGDTITLAADAAGDDITLRVGDGTSKGAGYTATIAANLSSSNNVSKTDLGTLVLTGSNNTLAGLTVSSGALDVTASGVVNTDTLTVDGSASDNATLTINGKNAALNLSDANLDAFQVAYKGTGTVLIENGAHLNNTADAFGRTASWIGTLKNSNGTVEVTGTGSQWNAGDMYLGISGHGTLLIADGGVVKHTDAVVAVGSNAGGGVGGSGAVLVTGKGSLWGSNTGMSIGAGGGKATTGTLTVADGGTVSTDGVTTVGLNVAVAAGSVGTVNIGAAAGDKATAAGTLDVPTVTFGDGTGTLVFNHTDAGYTFAPVLSGTGAVRQIAGTTTLTGNSKSFNGTVTVEGGTLGVDNNIGNSTVTVQKGGTLTGTGLIEGPTTVQDGGILAGKSGDQLTLASLDLKPGAIVNVSLGAPASKASDALFNLSNGLTLDGTLNVSDAGKFGKGTYRLINYDGKLTDNGLDIGSTPAGYASDDLTVQTSVADQVNLIVATGTSTTPTGTIQFWDGTSAGHAGNGKIDGGDGTWTSTGTTWTDADGKANGAMNPSPGFAIFQAAPGTVTVDDSAGPVAVTDMQFASDGYTVKGDAIKLDATDSMLRVGDGTGAGAKYTATVNADINGTGRVTKTDLGTLVLGGTDTWNGTTIKDGTLAIEGQLVSDVQVQSKATLSGHGTIKGDVTNTGTVAPGGSIGTLTVDGNYTNSADGVLKADIAPDGTSDLLKVTGKATLEGGMVDVVKAAGDYSGDTRYTLVDAAGGVSGTFAKLTQNTPFLNLALGYDAEHVYLNVLRNNVSFCDVAATRNQCATGTGAESTDVGSPVYDAIAAMPDEDTARAAFDELSGESYASTRAALLQDSRFVREAMNARLHRAGTARDNSHAIGGTAGAFWTHAWGHWGSADGDGNAADAKANGSGLLVGIDAPLGDHLRGGLTTGAGETSASVAARHSDANSRDTHFGAYLGGTWGGWKVDGGVAGSWHDITSHRTVDLALPGRLTADYKGRTLQAFAEGGYRFTSTHGSVEPYLNATHVAVRTGEVNEHGSAAALHSNRETTEVSYGTLGVHGLWHLSGEGATRISAYGTLGWRHAFGSNVAVAQNYFAGGERFTVTGVPWARNALMVQVGIDFAVGQHTSFRAGYSGMLAKQAKDHAAKMSLQVTF